MTEGRKQARTQRRGSEPSRSTNARQKNKQIGSLLLRPAGDEDSGGEDSDEDDGVDDAAGDEHD